MSEQGEIVLIPFPYSDLTGAKQRPALVLSNSRVNKSEDRICCLVTSNPTSEGIRLETRQITDGKLPFASWAKPHRLFTIHKRIVRKQLCRVSTRLHHKIVREVLRNLEPE